VRRRRVNSAGRVLGVNKKSHAHSRNAKRFVVNVYLLRASDTLPLLLPIAPEAGHSPRDAQRGARSPPFLAQPVRRRLQAPPDREDGCAADGTTHPFGIIL
jgi:hypothetical protein